MAVVGVAGKPLRLKDLLELDCDSCSAAGFRCYPRRLCVPVPAPAPVRQRQRHQLQLVPSLRPKPSHISIARSLSRRLRGGFNWRRHDEETAAAAVLSSSEPCAPPEAAAGSSSDSETSESGSSATSGAEGKSESDFSSASSDTPPACTAVAAAADVREAMMERGSKEAAGSGSGSEGDDKEQLSPVGVMDFPLDDDDEDDVADDAGDNCVCSPSFSDSLAQLQRRKAQLQRKIRRLQSAVDQLGAVDLDARFAASDSNRLADDVTAVQRQLRCCGAQEATTAPSCLGRSVDIHGDRDRDRGGQSLHGLLMATASAVGVVDGASERLFLDFFAEKAVPNLGSWESGEAAVRLAKGWLEGTGAQWGLKDVLCCREDLVAGMERSWRWSARAVDDEERSVGVVVAGLVVDELVGELLRDLLV